jgi:hypothetical protein
MSALSPLSGVKRKSNFGSVRSAFDPNRTLTYLLPDVCRATATVRLGIANTSPATAANEIAGG